jgi:hypothetical protein
MLDVLSPSPKMAMSPNNSAIYTGRRPLLFRLPPITAFICGGKGKNTNSITEGFSRVKNVKMW